MLASLILNFFAWFGRVFVRIAYKKEGLEACEVLEKNADGTASLWGLGFMAWILCAFVTVAGLSGGRFFPWSALYTVSYVAAYVAWFAWVRMKLPKIIEDAKAVTEDQLNSVTWLCVCGQRNSNFVYTCACGATKQQVKGTATQNGKPVRTATGWRCSCGQDHPAFVSSCPCGVNKSEIE